MYQRVTSFAMLSCRRDEHRTVWNSKADACLQKCSCLPCNLPSVNPSALYRNNVGWVREGTSASKGLPLAWQRSDSQQDDNKTMKMWPSRITRKWFLFYQIFQKQRNTTLSPGTKQAVSNMLMKLPTMMFDCDHPVGIMVGTAERSSLENDCRILSQLPRKADCRIRCMTSVLTL
jgi:hypothetical protein